MTTTQVQDRLADQAAHDAFQKEQAAGTAPRPPAERTVRGRLSQRFEETFTDTRGGVTFEYLTGEQVTSRLLEVLDYDGWSFVVVEHGINAEADEVWVRGRLEVYAGRPVAREQFGSQKIKRSRSTGAPLDIGFDLKGASTDALKKCASLFGVGLYLSEKEGVPTCQDCGKRITPLRVRDRVVPVEEQVERSRDAFGVVACMDCGKRRKDAAKGDG